MEKKLNLSKHKKRYCFDLDGVLCKTKSNFYKNSTPIKSAIKLVNKLYEKGNYILIYTSRYMGRSKDNPTLAKKRGYKYITGHVRKDIAKNFPNTEIIKTFPIWYDAKDPFSYYRRSI